MTGSLFAPAELSVDGAVTLVLGKRTSTKFKGYRVKISPDVAKAMRQIAQEMRDYLLARSSVNYADDLAFEAQTQYMVAARDGLTKHQQAPRRGKSTPPVERELIEMDPAALAVLDDASSLDQLSREQLRRLSFAFYAVVIGDEPSNRVAFVKQWNPYRTAQLGHVLTHFGDGLKKLDDPILAFAQDYDLLVTAEQVVIARPQAFEKIFRDIDSLKERIPGWSNAAVASLPLNDDSVQLIEQSARRSIRTASMLRGMNERGLFAKKYQIEDLQAQMANFGLDADRLIQDGKLVLKQEDIPDILKLVDEKLYNGWHSATRWDVSTRAKR